MWTNKGIATWFVSSIVEMWISYFNIVTLPRNGGFMKKYKGRQPYNRQKSAVIHKLSTNCG